MITDTVIKALEITGLSAIALYSVYIFDYFN